MTVETVWNDLNSFAQEIMVNYAAFSLEPYPDIPALWDLKRHKLIETRKAGVVLNGIPGVWLLTTGNGEAMLEWITNHGIQPRTDR